MQLRGTEGETVDLGATQVDAGSGQLVWDGVLPLSLIHILSAGTRGTLRVRFAGKTWWRLTDAVSLLTLIGLFMERRKERKKHV